MSRALVVLLVDASLRVTLMAALVAAILAVTRARAGSVCHAAWTSVLCAMLLMPILPALVPPITVPRSFWSSSFHMSPDLRFAPEREPAITLPLPGEAARSSTVTVSAPVTLPVPEPVRLVTWAGVAAVIYLLVLATFVGRLIVARSRLLRLERCAHSVEIAGIRGRVYSSELVSVPVTTGVFRPSILLPAGWASWPAEKLAAVLAHEKAHIARRDPLTHCLGYVNRCVFWFHPLAWWLEHKLAATAEDVCDDAAVQESGDRQCYAEVLLDMAEAVRRRGGRIAWAGVGIDGAGRLGQRIDRILRVDASSRISRGRKSAVAFGCVAAIVIAVACRQQLSATSLKEDLEVVAGLSQLNAEQQAYDSAHTMTAQQATELDAAVAKNPEDLTATKTLLMFYQWSGQKVLGWNEMVARRRPHLLWLIEHHPESELLSDIYPRGLTPQSDPVGYRQAKALWLAHAAAPNVTPGVLSNAAYFFQIADSGMAEQVLLRLQSIDPNGPTPRVRGSRYYEPWRWRLGTLYALTIVGPDAGSQYAAGVRKKLDESKDAVLLSAAGRYLILPPSEVQVDFDRVGLGRAYLARAAALDPSSDGGNLLRNLAATDRTRHLWEAMRARQAELVGEEIAGKMRSGEHLSSEQVKALAAVEYQAVSHMSEADRFAYLPSLADTSYMRGEVADYYGHDAVAAEAAWDRSQKYAQDLLVLAPKFKADSHYGDAIFEGNIVLGMNALRRRGDVKSALNSLRAAAQAPMLSDDYQYGSAGLDMRLTNYLLKAGERESVANFLERSSRINVSRKDQLLKDAAAIRSGRMPMAYQYMVTEH